MRIVVLSSSVYSETACAMASSLAKTGYVPVGVLATRTIDRGTLLRKLGQWGWAETTRYARTKILPQRRAEQSSAMNPYLHTLLEHDTTSFSNMRDLAVFYNFPVAVCRDQNAPDSIAQLKAWSPDLIIFTGGNILRGSLLAVPRFGVLNAHLALLPEIRGMSAPEWSLLLDVPVGITIHYIDAGIDTGPILLRSELPDAGRSESLIDLRNRLIAFGIEKTLEVVAKIDRGTISANPQPESGSDRQYFVMHDWLRAQAAACLMKTVPPLPRMHGQPHE